MKRKRVGKTRKWGEDDINPMDGIANLADVMLCLAVGIMLALITHWNVDIQVGGSSGMPDTGIAQEVQENDLNRVNQNEVNINQEGEGYEHLGQVYKDPQTGKIYIVTEEIEDENN